MYFYSCDDARCNEWLRLAKERMAVSDDNVDKNKQRYTIAAMSAKTVGSLGYDIWTFSFRLFFSSYFVRYMILRWLKENLNFYADAEITVLT